MSPWNQRYDQLKKASEPLNQLEQLFKASFEEQFTNAKVELINVREPLLFEDEDYIHITIVYSATGDLDTERSLSFNLLMRSKLLELNEERIPVDSFIEYHDFIENTPGGVVV